MWEAIIIIAIAIILYLIIRNISKVKDREVRVVSKRKPFNWVSVKRKVRGFFRGFGDRIKKIAKPRKSSKLKKKRVVRRIKVNIPKSYIKAKQLFADGDYTRAEKSCLRLITLRPNDAKLYYLLYQIYNKQDHFKDSVVALKAAIKRNQDSFWMMELGELYLKKEKIKQAEKIIKKAIKSNNTVPPRYAKLAEVQLELNKIDQAGISINRALEKEPHNSNYLDLKEKIEK